MPSSLPLRYGTNPQQAPARVYMKNDAELPITSRWLAGYINLFGAERPRSSVSSKPR
jgi:AICAR transformylase/IMP cyclohydrolase PurH